MHIDNIKMGPDGNIWLARADNSHTSGVPNPNDMVAIFTLNGTEVGTVSGGGMRHPLSVGWDTGGFIYVPAQDVFFATDVYKYDAGGNYVTKFHTAGWSLIDEYWDIATTAGDRIYVSSWHGTGNDDQMTEFNAVGETVNTFSPTGPFYFHRDVGLSPAGRIWVRTPRNGSGDDLVREFDLAGNQISSFSTSVAIPGSELRGLEVGANGHLFTLNVIDRVLYELDTDGSVVGQTPLTGLSNWITDFTFAPDGHILVANQTSEPVAVGEAASPVGLQLVGSPNPFRGKIDLRYSVPNSTPFDVSILDVVGRRLRLYRTSGPVGVISWDGTDDVGRFATPGVYFIRLDAGGQSETRRVVLIR
jgi:hypothetical protein